jgi:Zn-finger nucleic acid-binding protein
MNCPVCKTATLNAVVLPTGEAEGGLTARRCSTCGGHWVEGEVYFNWVEKRRSGGEAKAAGTAAPQGATQDSTKAKLCPTCGRMLTRAKVGNGLAFHLDRCRTCAGFWFDPGEWDALLAAGLHGQAHQVFSDAWQFEVQREERRVQHERSMIARLGQADWDEIQRVKAWIEGHPRRVELFAVLTEGREELTNRSGRSDEATKARSDEG